MRRTRWPRWLGIVALAGFVTACAGGATSTAPAATSAGGPSAVPGTAVPPAGTSAASQPGGSTVDACGLLTEADIKEITGYPIGEMDTNPLDTIFPSACEWKLAGTPYLISLGVTSPGGQAEWDAIVPYTKGDAVAGIGDAAFLSEIGGDLMVRKGDTFFDIQYVAPGTDDTQDRLAARVVEHLP